MLKIILEKTFGLLIGRLPKEKRELYWEKFSVLLADIARASAEGAVRGAKSEGI